MLQTYVVMTVIERPSTCSLHPFSLLTDFLSIEQRAPSFVLARFLGVYKGKLAFEVVAESPPAKLNVGSIAERQIGTSELSLKQTY